LYNKSAIKLLLSDLLTSVVSSCHDANTHDRLLKFGSRNWY